MVYLVIHTEEKNCISSFSSPQVRHDRLHAAPSRGRHVGGEARGGRDGLRAGRGRRLLHPLRGLHQREDRHQVHDGRNPGMQFNTVPKSIPKIVPKNVPKNPTKITAKKFKK